MAFHGTANSSMNKLDTNDSAGQTALKLFKLIDADKTNTFIKMMRQILSRYSLQNSCDSSGHESTSNKDLDYILNVSTYEQFHDPLIVYAARKNNIKIVEFLCQIKSVKINVTNMNNATALWQACFNNSTNMVSLLMKMNADPNTFDTIDQRTTMLLAAENGNLKMMKMLLNLSNNNDGKNFKCRFDWNKLINKHNKSLGINIFWMLCSEGHLQCLKYLLSVEKHFNVKMDRFSVSVDNENGLIAACDSNETEMIQYLIKNIFNNKSHSNKKFDINHTAEESVTAFYYCAANGNLAAIQAIIHEFGVHVIDTNKCDLDGGTPFWVACQANNIEVVRWMIKNLPNIDINSTDKHGITPLMAAIDEKHEEMIDVLLKCPNIKISEPRDGVDADTLVHALLSGSISVFCNVLLQVFKKANINSIEAMKKTSFMDEPEIVFSSWYKACEKYNLSGLYAFITKLHENGFKKKDFGFIKSLLFVNATKLNYTNEIEDSYLKLRSDDAVANYLFTNLNESTKNNIANIINHGLLTQQCGFNDCLLLLSKKINEKDFIATLRNVTNNCLSSKTKTVKSYNFFKNNLLHSNVWAMKNDSGGVTINKYEVKQDNDFKNNHENHDQFENLFDTINKDVILKELKHQKQFIKNEIIKLEKDHLSAFRQLKYDIKYLNIASEQITQNSCIVDYHGDNGIDLMCDNDKFQIDYELNELPCDNANGFDGKVEYDINGYLTKLLLASHQIDPIFQKHCKNYFQSLNEEFGIECQYFSAPVKTRERSIMKSKIDYKSKQWPHSCNILDLIRCSVVFKNIKHFLKGFNKFFAKHHLFYADDKISPIAGCVKQILRIKNDFADIGDNSWNLDVNSFNYCDIKCNVLIEYNNVKIIGEIQFLLGFMLDAKKLGHSIYSFQRKQEFYDKLSSTKEQDNNNDNNIIVHRLHSIISSKNMAKFSSYLEATTNLNEKLFIVQNEKNITQMLQQHHWTKGINLFQLFVQLYKSNLKSH